MSHTARDTILELFRKTDDGFLSGERISQSLGVSRTAVWKQIQALRELGYQIEAVPSQGYRLASKPDALLPEELKVDLNCKVLGARIEYFRETDSTNLQAHALGERGAAEGTVVIAEKQLRGKGRLGRQWISPPGLNLYLSVLLRPEILPWDAPQLTFLSAVAVCRAISENTPLQPTVKWPNDVLLNGRKVAGLLNEMSSETDRVKFVVLGVGVNLNMSEQDFVGELRYPATSVLLECKAPVSRIAFTRSLLQHLDALYQDYRQHGPKPILSAWSELSDLQGRRVVVDCQGSTIAGRALGIGEEGALLVEVAPGQVEKVFAGDVHPV